MWEEGALQECASEEEGVSQERVLQGVSEGLRQFFKLLPPQSSLRRPACRVLLDSLDMTDLSSLKLPLNNETVKRYRSEHYDVTPLLAKRRSVAGVVNSAFVEREKVAEGWVVNECGVTQSGRVRTVFKTELCFAGLFRRYQEAVLEQDQVSINVFARVTKRKHVHFGVGPVDTMSCILCREWRAALDDLQSDLLKENLSNRRRNNLLARVDEVTRKVEKHEAAMVRQRHAWQSDLNDVQNDPNLVLCVVDYSTFELMNRQTCSVFCVVVVENVAGNIQRRYFDFVDVRLSGRKRDVVYFAITLLYLRHVFLRGRRVRLWSDAGSSDFRNAPCLYSCLQLNTVCDGVVFESFNFFGARHGWNDCDRHFGNAKQAMSRWLVEVASSDKKVTLDVEQCCDILARLGATTAIKCTRAEITGVDHPSIKGLTKHYSFRFNIDATAMRVSIFSDERESKVVQFPNGRWLNPDQARASAKGRNGKKK